MSQTCKEVTKRDKPRIKKTKTYEKITWKIQISRKKS